jgi:hypothetical protein
MNALVAASSFALSPLLGQRQLHLAAYRQELRKRRLLDSVGAYLR